MKKIAFLILSFVLVVGVTSCKKTLSNDDEKTISILFDGDNVTVNNPCESGMDITVSKADVVVNSTLKKITYRVSGSSSNGQLKIYSDHKLTLLLDNLKLSNQRASAINIQTSKKTTIELQGASVLNDATIYTDTVATEDEKACLFSEGQLVFKGSGELTITSHNRHAICSDDYVRVASGKIVATSTQKDAIHAKDFFECIGGTLVLSAIDNGKNGIDVSKGYIKITDGDITVNALSKGIVADYVSSPNDSISPFITIDGGSVNVTTNGEGAHGLRTTGNFTMNGGTLTVIAQGLKSDGISADGQIVLNGGKACVTAENCTNVAPIERVAVLECDEKEK